MISASETQRKSRIDALFERALDLAPAERVGFVRSSSDDPAMAAELEELLRLIDSDDGRIAPAGAWSQDLLAEVLANDEHEPLAAGHELGAFRILDELGRGGMGVVYRAERADEAFDQVVAIKVIKRGTDTDEVVRRFRQERQILASLQHANVARLLDGGSTPDGRPYLVMEYVEGRRLDHACDARPLDLEARLDLFKVAVAAVGHAHQNLVVHRDLKPSNILVAEDGEVKLLDFGIAKLLDLGDPALTHAAASILTPDYASPEQLRGEPITTASDVYQLGLLLYELITGTRARPPIADGPLITEEDLRRPPQRPSAVVLKDPERRQLLAGSHSQRWLRQRLSGDLDTIVLKALQFEPSRRYLSAFELFDDLGRFFRGLPVAAQPDSWAYRARTFVRRHRVAVTVGSVLALTVLAYAATVTWQAREIARERDRAQAEANKAAEVRDFLIDLFEATDPSLAQGREVTARELLERSSTRIERELAGQDVVQAELFTAVGEIYRRMGLYPEAERLLIQGLDLARATYAPGVSTLPKAMENLGDLYRRQDRFDEARRLYEERLELVRASPSGDAPLQQATALADIGRVASETGDLELAQALFAQSLETLEAAAGESSEAMADALNDLGLNAWRRGDYDAAREHLSRSVTMYREWVAPDHPHLTATLANLALVARSLGRSAEAESLYLEALTSRERVLGPDHPLIATTARNLGLTLWDQQRLEEAQDQFERALGIRQRVFGDHHPRVAATLNDLGRIAEERDNLDEAEDFYRAALASYPVEHPWRGISRLNLANVLEKRGELAAAEAEIRSTLADDRERHGTEHLSVALDLRQLGRILHTRERLDEAYEAAREALDIYLSQLGPDDLQHEPARVLMAEVQLARGLASEAEPLLSVAHEARSERYGAEDERTLEVERLLEASRSATSGDGP